MKAIFVKRIDGEFCICPFIGYRANTSDDFISIVKKYFDKKTGYPGLVFSTDKRNVKVYFLGHQLICPDQKSKWFVGNDKTGEKHWIKDPEEAFSFLPDAKPIENKMAYFTELAKAGIGFEVSVD